MGRLGIAVGRIKHCLHRSLPFFEPFFVGFSFGSSSLVRGEAPGPSGLFALEMHEGYLDYLSKIACSA